MKAPERRAGPPRVVYVYLAIIVVTWAGNWPLMKLALDDAPPLVFVLLRLIGAAIGFAGLLLFMNPGLVDWSSGRTLLGNACLLLSAIAWAFGSCLYRRRIWRTGFWTQTFWQLVVSAPVVLAFALPQITDEP